MRSFLGKAREKKVMNSCGVWWCRRKKLPTEPERGFGLVKHLTEVDHDKAARQTRSN